MDLFNPQQSLCWGFCLFVIAINKIFEVNILQKFKTIYKERVQQVNRVLKEEMSIENNVVCHKLNKAMKYTLFSGGKRVRPFLVMEVADLIGGDENVACKVGAAIEIIHTYSLIHDDLPDMDDDDYRRGKLTNHKIYGSAMAILAGDGLLTYSFNLLSKIDLESDKLIKIIQLISYSAGYRGMIGGQALDILNESKNISLAKLKKIHRAKTGALFKSSILAGAYCGEPTEREIKALTNFAKYLGITFQVVDDILDVTGNAEKMGKRTGRDSDLNKVTYTSLLGVQGARKKAKEYAEEATKSLSIFTERAENLCKLVDYILHRQT